jgi:hypothetical protein
MAPIRPVAMRYASDHFTRHNYITIHLAGIVTAFLSALLIGVSSLLPPIPCSVYSDLRPPKLDR